MWHEELMVVIPVAVPVLAALCLLWVQRKARFRLLVRIAAAVMVLSAIPTLLGMLMLSGAISMFAAGLVVALVVGDRHEARAARDAASMESDACSC
ncbi:hypothetical protein [Cupriavidus pampae]|uniref:Uncharacterized protein n=1 Tax=Cupriavidus pampae TaxID=659251 RepID=A0ABM8XU04_9BURK|nr:hypothetical protein [Cupriavidus pampae]CAG9183845.1 hypothetical protein LMG32289_05440 [Cupriavidus pampae]